MSFVETVGKFHISLDGIGLLLQGAGENPAYRMSNAPVYGTRFASGDRDYNDLSQWWYLIQTDWSGGFKDTFSFEDDAKFYYSSNIDARTKPGTIRLEKQIALLFDNNVGGNDEIYSANVYTLAGSELDLMATNDGVKDFSGSSRYTVDGEHILVHKGYVWLSAGANVYNSSSTSFPVSPTSQTSSINGVIDGSIGNLSSCTFVVVGTTLFIIGISTTDKVFIVKTTVANPSSSGDYTLVAEFDTNNALGATPVGAQALGGEIIFLIEGEPLWNLYSLDIASSVVTPLYEFDNCVQNGIYGAGKRYVTKFGFNKLLITVKKNDASFEGAGEIWLYDGSNLTKIYSTDEAKRALSTREPLGCLDSGCVVYGGWAFWGNLAYDGESFFNTIKNFSDDEAQLLMPIGQDGTKLLLVDDVVAGGDDRSALYSYDKEGTAYKDGANHEAFLIFSQHDKLQSIDKLLNSITIGFEKFASGQEISVYYSTNPVPDPDITTGGWTLLGTASYSLDGGDAVSKVFPFPVGTTAKKIWFRVEMVSGGTNTPALTDFTLEYLPMPDYRFQWNLNINCSDEVKRIDGRKMEVTARELKSRLMKAWQTKSALDFGDIDYAQTAINDASPSASDTTITVDTTQFFPEQGRLKIDDEEIFYTGKTPTSFTGCVRGARGTRAADHADNAVVHNGYRVLVLSVNVDVPVLLEDKHTEYIVGLTLREV